MITNLLLISNLKLWTKKKVVRFQLDNGEWRSKVYYPKSDSDKEKKKQPRNNLSDVIRSSWYDINKYESYIHYLMGIEKEKPKTKENKTLFNRIITASWGQLQPELTSNEHKFAAQAHTYSPKELIDTLKNENATKNIERLSKMSREEVEKEYKSINKLALSNRDNIEQRVNNAFLKGEGLEDITINGKTYQGLLFDENSQQSQRLKENGTFKVYYNKYLSCMKELISETGDAKDIDIEAISKKLSSKLGKPNFSNFGEIRKFDYYGLMGGTQNVEVDFKITPTSNGEYSLKTTMNINDWYGADTDDINKKIDYKNVTITTAYAASYSAYTMSDKSLETFRDNIDSNFKSLIPGLQEFFYLQHHNGCKPFPTQIIYKSEDKIKLGN